MERMALLPSAPLFYRIVRFRRDFHGAEYPLRGYTVRAEPLLGAPCFPKISRRLATFPDVKKSQRIVGFIHFYFLQVG
jgi:hypothetical protein